MVGLVVVSHSKLAAEGIAEMAGQMAGSAKLIAAGGTDDGSIGTDATKIQAAIEEADSGDGVAVLVDLGSGVMSAELALEMLEPDLAARVKIADAPILEGAVAAAVQASVGSSLAEVIKTAEDARDLHKL
jgi:dihydroxyacetone kinase phosphotransfer subunit